MDGCTLRLRWLTHLAPCVLHITAILHFYLAEHYYQHYLKLPDHGPYQIFYTYGGRYKFLTVWNMLFQTVFYWICLVNDVIGSNESDPIRSPFIRKLRDFLHAAVGFPLSMFVGTSFWSLWLYDREIVFPKVLDQYFPVWLNHTMHSTIVIYTLLHGFLCHTHYPKRTAGLSTLLSLVALYVGWVLAVHFCAGMWTYPIFQILTWPQRILFFSTSVTIIVGWYFVGEIYNAAIWGSRVRNITSKNQ